MLFIVTVIGSTSGFASPLVSSAGMPRKQARANRQKAGKRYAHFMTISVAGGTSPSPLALAFGSVVVGVFERSIGVGGRGDRRSAAPANVSDSAGRTAGRLEVLHVLDECPLIVITELTPVGVA